MMKVTSLKRRLIAFAVLTITLIALAAPVVAHYVTASAEQPVKVAVNWNGRPPAVRP